jgi:hypothetical protein
MIYLSALFALVAAGMESSPVSLAPWGFDGHRVVCEIAYQNLEPGTRDAVDELLAGDPEERFRDFRESCVWADEVRGRREARYDTFRTAHYVNLPRRSDGFDLERDCGNTFCVVEAILEQKAILEDENAPIGARRDALKFVSHFVGDLHQPLHVGYEDDRGGNHIRLLVDGENLSLHSYWDSGFLSRSGEEWQQIARIRFDIRGIDRALWASDDPGDWANESFRIVEDHVYVFPISPEVEDEYYFRNIHSVEEQLKKAGIRLANLLNAALS